MWRGPGGYEGVAGALEPIRNGKIFWMINNIQLGVNSGAKRRGIYLALFTDAEGDSSFSIYLFSWIKMKKVTFL